MSHLLVFDQTLSSTGWVWVRSDIDGLKLIDHGTIKTAPLEKEGHMANLQRSPLVYSQVLDLAYRFDRVVDFLIHEMPPVGRPGMHRPESSLMAATVIHIVGSRLGIPVTAVSAQSAKRTLTGFANAPKNVVAEAIRDLWPDMKLPNEHVRDAWALAWQYHKETYGDD